MKLRPTKQQWIDLVAGLITLPFFFAVDIGIALVVVTPIAFAASLVDELSDAFYWVSMIGAWALFLLLVKITIIEMDKLKAWVVMQINKLLNRLEKKDVVTVE